MAKKGLVLSLAAIAAFGAVMFAGAKEASADAQSEIAMELSTGAVLEENNADLRLPMASTTKIMTAIIVIEDCDVDEVITVPDEAVGVEGSSIYLETDEKISVKDLLYGLMLRSGNDAATALAVHHSGSVQKFAEVMNERAKEMGAECTNFVNPSGLPDENHFTTARDLCRIACHAMKNPLFKAIVGTKSYDGEYRNFTNKNKMLFNYDGANGVKTGYTKTAGRCLVSSAERNGMEVVCVVLNCPDMYERSQKILNCCFANFKLEKILGNRVFMCDKVLCKPQKDIVFVAKSDSEMQIKVVPVKNSKKIKKGDLVAKLEIYSENNLILSEDLYSIING